MEVPLPTDKLRCMRGAHKAGQAYRPVVLLSCGSFNPPTNAHLRMFELAAQQLQEVSSTGADSLLWASCRCMMSQHGLQFDCLDMY